MTVDINDGWLSGSLQDDTGKAWPIVQHRQPSARGLLKTGVPNLILHTTETDGYVEQLKYPSQWQTGEGKIGQHIQLGYAGDAVFTYDSFAQQIEMVGRSKLEKWLPPESTLGPTVALVAWLHQAGRIKTGLQRPADWPVVLDKGPQATTSYYRRQADLWPATPGVYGHVEIPTNSHWDPGSFDYPTFFKRVEAAIKVQNGNGEEDDQMFKEWYAGFRAHEAGEPKPADGLALKGWLDRAQLLKEAKKHSHEGTANLTITVS